MAGKHKKGIERYLRFMPRDKNGKPYRIGGYIRTERFGDGRVLGIARGVDRSDCIVASFHQSELKRRKVRHNGWKTWLVRAADNIALDREPDGYGQEEGEQHAVTKG